MSLEGDVCKQTGFPVNFGGLGCRRAEDIALPSLLAPMNSVSELMETIFSNINLADTNQLAEAVESWRTTSGGAPYQMTLVVRKLGTFLLLREIGKACCVVHIRCLEPACWPRT